MVSYPIVAPEFGDETDPEWAADVTEAANDHEDRITEVEFVNNVTGDCSYWTGGALASSSGAETAHAAWTADKTFTFRSGRVYALDAQFMAYHAGGTFGTVERIQVNVRKAVNSVVAQLLGSTLLTTQGTGTSGAQERMCRRYVANQTGADITGVHLGLTVNRITGAAVNSIYGDASFPASITVLDVGSVADNPNLAVIAVEIT
jgi:hypothetical protein